MAKILVVDDSAVDRTLVAGLLSRDASLSIVAVEIGTLALERMQSSPADVIVTDLQMPEIDGV